MLFSSVAPDTGCKCIGCGNSKYEGIGTVVRRNDGKLDVIIICSRCLFVAAVGEKAWNAALGREDAPVQIPAPAPIRPRLFG